MKFLKEEIISLENVILEFRSKFNFEQFKKMDQEQKIAYAEANLPFLGKGTARIVFALPNMNYVLKIARNAKGNAQNEAEVDVYANPVSRPVVTRIRDSAPDYSWVVSEIARPMHSQDEFDKAVGIENKKQFTSLMNHIDLKAPLRQNLAQNKFFKALYDMAMSNHMMTADLDDYKHYGKTADGRTVLLDYGYNQDVFQKHYKK